MNGMRGKTVLVLGLGESGLAMAQWLHARAPACASPIRAMRRRMPPNWRSAPGAVLLTGSFNEELLDGVDLIALSPGVSLSEPLVVEAARRGVPVVGEIELFAGALRELGLRDRCRVVAITGTNGKTTTTAMAGTLCRAAGMVTAVAGNIGPAALDALMTLPRCRASCRKSGCSNCRASSWRPRGLDARSGGGAQCLRGSSRSLRRDGRLRGGQGAHLRGSGVQVLNRDDRAASWRWRAPIGAD